jgi:type III secretion protein R
MDSPQLPSVMLLVIISVVPLLLLSATSFVKVSMVFSLLRNGFGVTDVPSGAVITALAVVVSVVIMTPVTQQVIDGAAPWMTNLTQPDTKGSPSGKEATVLFRLLDACKTPWRKFLTANAGKEERALFTDLVTRKSANSTISSDDFRVLLPSFLITELREALQMGFVVLLPFLMVDLIVVNVLTAVGLYAMSPAAVALPLKLLLFLALDGWVVLSKALVLSYH